MANCNSEYLADDVPFPFATIVEPSSSSGWWWCIIISSWCNSPPWWTPPPPLVLFDICCCCCCWWWLCCCCWCIICSGCMMNAPLERPPPDVGDIDWTLYSMISSWCWCCCCCCWWCNSACCCCWCGDKWPVGPPLVRDDLMWCDEDDVRFSMVAAVWLPAFVLALTWTWASRRSIGTFSVWAAARAPDDRVDVFDWICGREDKKNGETLKNSSNWLIKSESPLVVIG